MAYSTYSDVQKLFTGITFSASTPVTTTEITSIIVEVDAMIDARLRARYTVPITDTDDLPALRYISARFAAQEVWDILYSETMAGANPNAPQEGASRLWERRAEALLSKIESGEVPLDTALNQVATWGGRYESDDDPDDGVGDPAFTMDMVF